MCDYVERAGRVKQIMLNLNIRLRRRRLRRSRPIRHKLRIANQKINLASYLQSLRRGDSKEKLATGQNYIG